MKLIDINPGKLLVDVAYAAFQKVRNRPKAVERRAAKAARKSGQRGELDETAEDFNVPTDEDGMDKLKAFLSKVSTLRTSTKSGAAGIVVPWVAAGAVLLPFYEPISAYVAEACAQPQPLDFLIAGATAWAVTWSSMLVSARLSKTPANPGKL